VRLYFPDNTVHLGLAKLESDLSDWPQEMYKLVEPFIKQCRRGAASDVFFSLFKLAFAYEALAAGAYHKIYYDYWRDRRPPRDPDASASSFRLSPFGNLPPGPAAQGEL